VNYRATRRHVLDITLLNALVITRIIAGNIIAIVERWLHWIVILSMEGECEQKLKSEQIINVEKYRRLVKSYIDLVSITGYKLLYVIMCHRYDVVWCLTCNLCSNLFVQHLYSAALFWADKVVSLSNGDAQDVYWLAQCMFLMKQYHRAAHLIRSRGLEKVRMNQIL
jgi:hypothetical protein